MSVKGTPNIALRFLEWFCPPALYEGIEGDLLEEYEADVKTRGARKAKLIFVWNVLKFFRPGIILRNKFNRELINISMLGNYIKVASRNIAKRKLYSFINAFGLSVAIAFCTLIYLFVQDEKSFDQFHENKDLIYRLHTTTFDQTAFEKGEKTPYSDHANLPAPLGVAMLDELMEVDQMTRFYKAQGTMRYEDKVFKETGVVYVDSGFFKMFSFPLTAGNKNRLFRNNADAILTEEMANKYFGDEDPIGKTFSFFNSSEQVFTVAAIIKAPPGNSSLQFEMLLPVSALPHFEYIKDVWGGFSFPTFIQISPQADPGIFKIHLDSLVNKYMADTHKQWREWSKIPAQFKVSEFNFMKLSDIHLASSIDWIYVSDPLYTWILSGLAILILLIAGINYVSLALTTSMTRKVEVGVRKTMGAFRSQLISQFGFESIILVTLSMVMGMGLVMLFFPLFNEFTGKQIAIDVTNVISLAGAGVLLILVISILAGSYPAFFLSRFLPAAVLKGGDVSKVQTRLTKSLVVFQFFLSAFLVICAVSMMQQMKYVINKNLGYNSDQILAVELGLGVSWSEADKSVEQLRNALGNTSKVKSVSGTSSTFSKQPIQIGYQFKGENKDLHIYRIDGEYIPLLGIELIEGRNFDDQNPSDKGSIIVNEALVKDLGWKDPLSEYLNWKGDTTRGYKVIGVVKDYHFLSLEEKIKPMILSLDRRSFGYFGYALIKISSDDIPGNIELVKSTWSQLFPERPFQYSFLEDDLAHQYENHARWTSIAGLAAIFAIVIACLGLFGLAGINALNRTKEIGIRKVMGADLGSIFILLNRQYIWLACISFTLASPASWYAINKWLSTFQFRIDVGWELFAISMLTGLIVALVAVSYHGIKASRVNPADTLKYE